MWMKIIFHHHPPPPQQQQQQQRQRRLLQSSLASSIHQDEFLTLQINQNENGLPTSYNVEIKPSSSSSSSSTNHMGHNNNHQSMNQYHHHQQPSIDSPPPPPPSAATISSTFVRQFKHQTFQSESPKHVSSFSRLSQQHQQGSPSMTATAATTTTTTTQQQSSSTSPKLYSSPNISPNKQIIRSKILKESPRKSSVSYCSNEFTKKSFVGETPTSTICDIVETTIGAPSVGRGDSNDDSNCNDNVASKQTSTTYLVKYKTCVNEALCTSDCNAATATISSNINGIGNGNSRSIEWLTDGNHSSIRHNHHHHHHHQTTIPYVPSQSFQTYHIYDDTDLVTMKTNLDESKQQQQQQQSGIVRKSKNPKDDPDLIEDDSTDHYIRNVEQVVKSLSEKLQLQQQQQQQQQLQNDENGHHLISNHHNNNQYHPSSIDHGRNLSFRSNSLSYDGDDYRSTTASSLSTLQLQQTPSRRFIMNGIDNNQNNRSTGEQRRRNMSITSLISLQQQQQQPNTMDRLRSLISRSNHHQNRNDNNNNLLINKNRSLPASPLMNTNRKEMNLNLQTTSSSITTTTATRQRSSNGRHFFHSPKVVRKLRRKLSYLDCSSEDDENNTSDDDDDLENQIGSSSSSPSIIMDRNNGSKSIKMEKKKIKNEKYRRQKYGDDDDDDDNEKSKRFVLHNKAPLWNEISQVYQLDFGGRVTQESAKNFQIEYQGRQVMQFGRIDTNAYTLDFEYPFSAVQAMAVALANVTQRLK
nr:GATA zinc finger domain-containing protein 14-like [Dermatophagoides farinae]